MRILLYLLPLFLIGCTSSTDSAPASSAITNLLQPNKEELSYPVYESFDDIAPLFTQDDDKTYVINFWATWCKPCVEEMPYFEQLAKEAGPDTEVIAVSLDFKKDIETKLKKFVDGHPDLPPVIALADSKYNDWIDRVDPDWGGAIPVTVIYRGDKRVFHSEKYNSYAELKSSVDAIR
ncbi:TlpA disulfide reductase family protein [Neolewinella agarilytica]|uniref:Thiol-disulfide isomerase or thioredoxin n=1 Tax=Neolewinella agarilytica TaxID=478744 RepID=A0A1H9KMW2_9BACT|nr:TlpA disulfide reductase family protein [Neolewinella agarilytica]SER00432.1 Thiol-disulfide isomerase or thioredoxin [Neolewinella agarilytica]